MNDAECFFCKFARKEIATDIVYEDDQVFAFRDINPQAPVHVLIIPKRHIRDLRELKPGDGPLLEALVAGVNLVAEKEGIAEPGFRVVANTGSNGGQTVFHLHFHVLGGRRMTWPPG